jgi:hypothetical protein
MLPRCVQLLTLPTELRLQILSFALLIDCGDERIANLDISRRFRRPVSHDTTNVGLPVCRQIYHEAHLLPFQNSEFALYGLSTVECLKFFQQLQPWKTSALRSLKLDITEADLDVLGRVDEVCSCLFPTSIDGVKEFTRPGLQNLLIHVSRAGVWPHPADFEALFDLARKWSAQGILRLTSLRTLTITLAASVKLPPQTANAFEEQLRDRMPWCSKVSVGVQPEKSPRAKFEEFAKSMGWGPSGPGSIHGTRLIRHLSEEFRT